MLVEQEGNLLVQFDVEHLTRLAEGGDLVIAGWANPDDIPREDVPREDSDEVDVVVQGEILYTDHGVTMWMGTREVAFDSDNDLHRVRETPRVWLDSASARMWLEVTDGDASAALDILNEFVVHDADTSAPDCDERDPGTGFTCTLGAGHDGDKHVAGLGRACLALVFTTES